VLLCSVAPVIAVGNQVLCTDGNLGLVRSGHLLLVLTLTVLGFWTCGTNGQYSLAESVLDLGSIRTMTTFLFNSHDIALVGCTENVLHQFFIMCVIILVGMCLPSHCLTYISAVHL
jgi:hypothetical protein